MTLKLSELKTNWPEEAKEFEGVGEVVMKDTGVESYDKLQAFYDRNYYPGYILGDEKLFSWMFKNNGGKVATLWRGDQIAAHQGHVPVVFTNGDKDWKGFISASTMVDPDFRRKGLMSYLRGSVQKRYQMAVSIGGSPMGVALYSNMGYKLYGDMFRVIGVINEDKCKGIVKNKDKLKATVELNQNSDATVKAIESFAEISNQIDDLRNNIFEAGKYFGVKRDAEFFDWRYASHPTFDYQRFGLWESRELKALIVFRVEQIPEAATQVIRVTELIGKDESLQKLVQGTILNERISKDIGWIDFFCANEKICDSLKVLGFKSPEELEPVVFPIYCSPVDYYKKKYPVMIWSSDESVHEKLPPLKDWYVTKGDGDADRPNSTKNYKIRN